MLSQRMPMLVFIAVLFYVAISIVGNIREYQKYQQELATHKANIDQLTEDNLQLSELLTFLNTDDAVDAYARTRLGLQQQGERAFIITQEGIQNTKRVDDLPIVEEPNTQKWFRYFFY